MNTVVEINPAYFQPLSTIGLTDFQAFMKLTGGEPTSRHEYRETLPVDLSIDGQMQRFFLKRVYVVPPRHALTPLVRFKSGRSQPWQEWHICQALEKAGVPVMKAVAMGERRVLGVPTQAFLLVEAVPMTYTLENWLVPGFSRPRHVDAATRRQILFELGQLLRQISNAGFYWPDVSAKHIFAAPKEQTTSDGRRWNFCLIDVERVTHGDGEVIANGSTTISESHKAQMLNAMLRKLLMSMVPMVWQENDIKELAAGLLLSSDANDVPRVLQSALTQSRRLPRLPDDFMHPRTLRLWNKGKMAAAEELIDFFQSAGIDSLDAVFGYQGSSLNKAGLDPHRERIRMELTSKAGEKKTFYLKRYQRPPLSEQWARIRECGLGRSTGAREIYFIKRLAHLGIPTMRGAAYGQEMNGLYERRSFGITQELRGESLEKLADRIQRDPSATLSFVERRDIIEQLALVASRLHAHHFFHRDLYLCHVFFSRNADGRAVISLIDLARMIHRPALKNRWIIKDLAALNYSAPAAIVSRADRLRFLYHYLPDVRGLGRSERKQQARDIIRRIEARTRRLALHDEHRNQRLRSRERA